MVTKVLILIAQRLGLIDAKLGRTYGTTLHLQSPTKLCGIPLVECPANPIGAVSGGTQSDVVGMKKVCGTVG